MAQLGSPAFIKLARLLRDYGISRRAALHALEVLAANKYISRAGEFRSYRVTWTSPERR